MYKAILVDDDKWALKDISKVFRSVQSNFELAATFSSVDQAMVYLLSTPVDLVLTDVRMAGKTGFDLLRIAKENHIDFTRIIISGYDDFEYIQKAFYWKSFYYLLKPVKKEELQMVLERACIEIALKNNTAPTPSMAGEGDEGSIYDQAVAYINEHCFESFTLEELADRLFVSTSYLSRNFAKHSGCTISYYRNVLRIQHAKQMLGESDRTITVIAQMIGYDNSSYFCRKFKEIEGITPQEFRRNTKE